MWGEGWGDTIWNGKWGNVLRTGGEDLQLVRESAHAELGMDADRSAYATAARQPAPAGPAGTDRGLVKAVQDFADRYIAGVAAQDEIGPNLVASMESSRMWVGLTSGGALIIGIALAFVISNFISRPVVKMADTLGDVAE